MDLPGEHVDEANEAEPRGKAKSALRPLRTSDFGSVQELRASGNTVQNTSANHVVRPLGILTETRRRTTPHI